MNTIENNARIRTMLVSLSLSQWYNTKKDDRARQTVKNKHNVKDSKDRYIKYLLPPQAMARITNIISRIRYVHNKNTLPWFDGGVRVLPSQKYFEYLSTMNELRRRLEDEVILFTNDLPNWIEQAKDLKGDLFSTNDYPSVDKIRDSFSLNIEFLPVPNVKDFRLDIPEEQLTDLKNKMDNTISNSLQSASDFFGKQVRDALRSLRDILSDSDKKFRVTRFNSLRELTEDEPAMNFLENEKITKLCVDTRIDILTLDVQSIRDFPRYRADAMKAIDKILIECKK